MSTDWTADRAIAKVKKPPKRPRMPPPYPRAMVIYIMITSALAYLRNNADHKYGTATVNAIVLLTVIYCGQLWVQWIRWRQYYKAPIPKYEGLQRIWNTSICVAVIVGDIAGLVFSHKFPWDGSW